MIINLKCKLNLVYHEERKRKEECCSTDRFLHLFYLQNKNQIKGKRKENDFFVFYCVRTMEFNVTMMECF